MKEKLIKIKAIKLSALIIGSALVGVLLSRFADKTIDVFPFPWGSLVFILIAIIIFFCVYLTLISPIE